MLRRGQMKVNINRKNIFINDIWMSYNIIVCGT